MHVPLPIVFLSIGAVLVSGCFGGDEDSDPAPSPPTPFVFVDPMNSTRDHDHRDFAAHELALNMTLVGHHPLTEQEGEAAKSHSIDVCERWAVLGREDPGSYGVDIVDISDPANLTWVGQYRDVKAAPADRDVAWSADCNYVFMANQGSTADSSGIRVINARDKTKPTFESLYPGPTGTTGLPTGTSLLSFHTVYALKVGSVQYVYGLNYGVHILALEPDPNGKMILTPKGRYITADAEQLMLVNQGQPDPTSTRRAIYGHDMTVYQEGGRVILYVAYAYDGLRIVDITDPTRPAELTHWAPNETPGAPHYVHSVKSYARSDGKRITILGSETFEDRNLRTPSPLWVLDTTSLQDLKLLATWTNPGQHGADHLLFSLHFYEVEKEKLWLTHYHGGVWVLNLTQPDRLSIDGYYMPHEDTGYVPPDDCCMGWKFAGIPMTFDIKVVNGVGFAADFSTGLYALRLT